MKDDTDRAIAIVEDSRQTHVNWADWRRKGNGTDTDHEMIGDLKWHENAIRDYDHVLSVLRSARATQPALDVEHVAEALHAAGIGCSSEICDVRTSTYEGVRRTMHETDARDFLARLTSKEERP